MAEDARVELMIGDAGRVTIYGVHPVQGGEYEYSVTIDGPDVEAFATALGTTVDGLKEAWERQQGGIVHEGEPHWLKAHGVKYEFHSWLSQD